jgi:hypothetical protein
MKMSVLTAGWLLALILGLTACRSIEPTTGSPVEVRPEVTLQATDAVRIRDVARRLFHERGYREMASPLLEELLFDRPMPEESNRALRVRLRLTPNGQDQWRVTGVPLGVERWGTELETETVVRAGYSQIQDILETLKIQVKQGDR